MIPSAHLAALLELVDEYRDNPDVPADRLLQRYVKERRFIGSKDRQEISGQFFGFLRYQRRIAWHLQMAGVLHPTARDILIAYHILSTKMAEQTLETLFSGERYAPPKLERDELKLLRALKQQLGDESLAVPLGVQGECPDVLLPSLQQQFGERLATELNALQRSAPLDLRANTLKATRDEVMESLLHSGVNAEACTYSPVGIRLTKRIPLETFAVFKNGWVEVQDESSQLCALAVDAKAGMAVLDLCAGAGGKTLALVATMQNKGRLVACDVHDKRLERAKLRLRRAGVDNTSLRLLDDQWLRRQKEKFDRVLIDAPCSGSGTWRRNPDARTRYDMASVAELQQKQQELLALAAPLVKKGGRLIYSTCSLLPEENQQQAVWFVENFPNFKPVDVREIVHSVAHTPLTTQMANTLAPHSLQLTPAQHGTDGFFMAVWERVT